MGVLCEHICGGTIVSKSAIITAAHCLPQSSVYTFKIVAGILNLNDHVEGMQTIDVARYSIHPEYNVNDQ